MRTTLALVAAAVLVQALPARAALITDPGVNGENEFGGTLGYEFTLSDTQVVSALGVYNGFGLNASHEIGIWDASGDLLTEGTVAAHTPGDSSDFSYTTDLSNPAVVLLADTDYWVGADYSTGDGVLQDINNDQGYVAPTFASDVTYIAPRYGPTYFAQPMNVGDVSEGGAYIGPNIEFVSAPEPTSLALLSLGGLALLRRRRA